MAITDFKNCMLFGNNRGGTGMNGGGERSIARRMILKAFVCKDDELTPFRNCNSAQNKYVYDSSNYIKFKKLQAIKKTGGGC
tara:strand:- start:75 stop:320 length:246 start_codon:yes stop_codon:yes gene_type:complete